MSSEYIPVEALERPIAYHRAFREITGSTVAAVFLSQAWYWTRRLPPEREGWFYKTQAEWEEETGLSRKEQETARRHLKSAGLIEEKKEGIPAKLWFRVDEAAVAAAITKEYGADKDARMGHTGMPEPGNQERPNGADIHTETTAETTTETSSPKRKSQRLDDHWVPGDSTLQWAEREGFTSEQVQAQRPRFIDYHLSTKKPIKDYDRAFQLWMRNAREWGHLKGNGKHGGEDQAARLFQQAQQERAARMNGGR